ncbi:MAG: hypothetical protein LBS09_04505 [Bacteroidales bacterium]|jgi:hypothetical protein|nr:hypothetical protein [Bacteroidales bacterium]
MRNTIHKLLQQHISITQTAGYAFAAVTGMSIIFAAFSFSTDIRPLFAPETQLFNREIMVINKKVSPAALFNSSLTAFTDDEIEELRQQPFVRSLAYFTPGRFQVKAFTETSGQMPRMSTDLFFESVPDRLIGTLPEQWSWDENNSVISVMLPRDYLNLYNFGFSGSQGLPQLSESIVQQVSFKIYLTGNGKRETFTGKITGFTDHLNTILVPEAFMQWANDRFGESDHPSRISRLIIEADNPADPAIASFFAARENYLLNNNKGEQGKLSYILKMLIIIVITVGFLILLPAVGLMFLSIHLLVYKNREVLGNLILLGYGRSRLAMPYSIFALALNIVIGMFSLLLAYYARVLYAGKISTLGFDLSGFGITVVFAAVFVWAVTLLDILWIHRRINRIDIPARG